MNNFFRALIAGYGAKKLGGGCFGTIIVFIIIWVALGQCSFSSRKVPPPQAYPSKVKYLVSDDRSVDRTGFDAFFLSFTCRTHSKTLACASLSAARISSRLAYPRPSSLSWPPATIVGKHAIRV